MTTSQKPSSQHHHECKDPMYHHHRTSINTPREWILQPTVTAPPEMRRSLRSFLLPALTFRRSPKTPTPTHTLTNPTTTTTTTTKTKKCEEKNGENNTKNETDKNEAGFEEIVGLYHIHDVDPVVSSSNEDGSTTLVQTTTETMKKKRVSFQISPLKPRILFPPPTQEGNGKVEQGCR